MVVAFAYPRSKARSDVCPTIKIIDITPHHPENESYHPHRGSFYRFAFVIMARTISVVAPGIEHWIIDLETKLLELGVLLYREYATKDLFK
jgi:hypothetical protein